ncbi:MAG: hypothetical protein RJR34_12910 [Candidatus Methanoculleus thermohydrogenotrophicum]|nr:hypothetical protein [Candidatus Methanoculleus thermohydrogenotrophicum]
MTSKQIMRIHTTAGVEEIDADRLIVEGDEYVLFRGEEEVRRVKIADILSETDPETGEEAGGIETIYSRS